MHLRKVCDVMYYDDASHSIHFHRLFSKFNTYNFNHYLLHLASSCAEL